jgi:C1q domain
MAYDGPFPIIVKDGGTGAATLTGVVVGSGTSALTATGITQYNVLTGGASNAPNSVAPSATSGVPLISQGSSSQPAFGTAVVAGGGTGDTSFTAYAPICGGTTTTGVLQSASTGISTSGYVLTSTGSSSLPTFQAVSASGSVTTIDGDSGSATPSSGVVTISGGTTGLTTSGSSATLDLTGTLGIANGGTDATSFGTSGGLVVYNGTRLVTYSGLVSTTGGVINNSNTPGFQAYTAGHSNVTGDGTSYTCIFESTNFNTGSGYSTSTGVFTVPAGEGGIYHFSCSVQFTNAASNNTSANLAFYNGSSYIYVYQGNPYASGVSGDIIAGGSVTYSLSAGATISVVMYCANGSKVVSFASNSSFSGVKIA